MSSIDERLSNIDRIVQGLVGGPSVQAKVEDYLARCQNTSRSTDGETTSQTVHHSQAPTPSSSQSDHPQDNPWIDVVYSPNDGLGDSDEDSDAEHDDGGIDAEGLSSLTAHSTFAAGLLQGMIAKSEASDINSDTQNLVNDLNHTIETAKSHRRSPRNRQATRIAAQSTARPGRKMIPLKVALEIIKEARRM